MTGLLVWHFHCEFLLNAFLLTVIHIMYFLTFYYNQCCNEICLEEDAGIFWFYTLWEGWLESQPKHHYIDTISLSPIVPSASSQVYGQMIWLGKLSCIKLSLLGSGCCGRHTSKRDLLQMLKKNFLSFQQLILVQIGAFCLFAPKQANDNLWWILRIRVYMVSSDPWFGLLKGCRFELAPVIIFMW